MVNDGLFLRWRQSVGEGATCVVEQGHWIDECVSASVCVCVCVYTSNLNGTAGARRL